MRRPLVIVTLAGLAGTGCDRSSSALPGAARPDTDYVRVMAVMLDSDGRSYERFEVLDILVSDTKVAAEIRLIADLPHGNRIDEVVIHMWTFGQDDKVIALRRMLDTAANIAAADVSPLHLPAH